MRIAVAGFQHETNTFGVTKAGFEQFEMADSWPPLLQGQDVIDRTAGINLPMAGFVEAARHTPDIELIPILWCSAEPSAHVRDDAFERITGMILDGIERSAPVDAVYLDLHGAMVTESFEDGEGELIARLRARLGSNMPIAVSLDLHANITPLMVRATDFIAIFRSYPHLDMAETGARCLAPLRRLMRRERLCRAFRQFPYLVPLPAQYTGHEPCRSLYAMAAEPGAGDGVSADIAMGFHAADIHDCGPSLVAYAPDQATADGMAERLLAKVHAVEHDFRSDLMAPDQAVRTAMAHDDDRPVVIADVQDNPGAGATSDTTGLLEALVRNRAQAAILGLMHDPSMAANALRAGLGAQITGELGGKSGLPDQRPFAGRFRVEALGDGLCRYTGLMYGGSTAHLGPTAVLRVDEEQADVRVVVTSNRSQCLDLANFSHIGIDPTRARIIVVKSTVHFRADFEPIAARIINAAAPGACPCRLDQIAFRRLRPGMRVG